jgi:hypothetical protein
MEAVHERCWHLSTVWPAHVGVLQQLWEHWRTRKLAHAPDDAADGASAHLPMWLRDYAGGRLPTPGPEPAPLFDLFLRTVVVHWCAAMPDAMVLPTPAVIEAARQDKAWMRLFAGYGRFSGGGAQACVT